LLQRHHSGAPIPITMMPAANNRSRDVYFENGGRLVDIGRDAVAGWITSTRP
jgi:hypothetical protein